MADYIDRQDVIETVAFYREDPDGIDHALNSIKSIPSADVQPVVRCNECNLYDGVREVYGFASCTYWMQMTRWDDYCSHGVRKDGGQ